MISYTRTHILSTVSSVSCCVVAYVATEPETVFTDDFFTRNLMCSMQAKLPVFGSHLKGKMPANAIALGPRIRTFAKSPKKRPPIRRWLPSNGTGVGGGRKLHTSGGP